MIKQTILPAEWYPQSAIQLTWPHEETDWAPILDEVIPCFVAIAKEVIKHELLLIVCPDEQQVRAQLGEVDDIRIRFREMETNDTWARDHGGISIFEEGKPMLYDFVFNGWGMKFPGQPRQPDHPSALPDAYLRRGGGSREYATVRVGRG